MKNHRDLLPALFTAAAVVSAILMHFKGFESYPQYAVAAVLFIALAMLTARKEGPSDQETEKGP